jgi:OOP family OmpA-OmpF porin
VNKTKKIALAVALLCSAGGTLAQQINPSWYVQPSVVGLKTDTDFGVDEKSWGGGLRFGKPVHPMWDIQFGGTHVNTASFPNYYKQSTLGIDALLMFSRDKWRPFVLFGVGGEKDKVDNPIRNVDKWSPYFALGLGFQVSLTPQWSLQADVRALRAKLKDDDQYGFDKATSKYFTLALNYAFNPPPAPPAPAPEPTPVVEQPAPQPEPVAPPPPPPAKFEKVTLSATELFGFDSATLNMPQPKLDDIAAALQADTSITDVDVTGYTDRLGSKKYNQKLSLRRAGAVRDYLISKGVDGSRLKAVGKGPDNPIVTDCKQKKRSELIACLAPNRRVEVEQITVEKRVQ